MGKKTDPSDEVHTVDEMPAEYGTVTIIGSESIDNLPVDLGDVRNDKLLIAVRAKESDVGLFDVLMEEVAEEVASLKALRKQVTGGDVAASAIISEKRINALKRLAELTAMRSKEFRDSAGGKIDFKSESFQKVLEYLTTLIIEASKEAGMQETTSQRFFLKLKQKFNGFEEMAERVYTGDSSANKGKKAAENTAAFHKGRRE